ncbi:Zn-dependent exopeptidase [Dentipellis sp. KUC8613]|nr:Zn-dependent exopeptidase [Dentipellis sp. KUC8613]
MAPSNIPHPSLSQHLHDKGGPPALIHTLHQDKSSVLSIIADERYIYSGSQCQDISVWDNRSYALKTTLRGHTGSVLALEYAPDKHWLLSSSGDSTIRIWSTRTLAPIYVLNPYLDTDAGDLFSLVWSPTLKTVYFGCQNTSLQWYPFPDSPNPNGEDAAFAPSSGTSTPSRRAHRFFDSHPRFQRSVSPSTRTPPVPALPSSPDLSGHVQRAQVPTPRATLCVPASNVIDSAHFGYIYCMALLPSTRDGSDDPPSDHVQLVTGSGDEAIKLWECTPNGPELVHSFECAHGAVLSLAAHGDIVFAGCQDGYVKVWDTQTRTLVRTIMVHENVDVLSLSVMHSDLYTFSANGKINRYSDTYDCTASWRAHDGIILSSIVSRVCTGAPADGPAEREFQLLTGGNDGSIKVWSICPPKASYHRGPKSPLEVYPANPAAHNDLLMYALSKFVSIPSVSSTPAHREDCRQAAIWLAKCLHQLGAHSKTLSTGDVHNPIVFATFEGAATGRKKPRILFYGHYDVIAAPPTGWDSPPFDLTARNGFLYGRGVTDDKGPVLAVACAAAELLQQRRLGADLVFLVEGEEETGSVGFKETVKTHKDLIGEVDAILVSNSTWISSDTPCITYGLRGVVHCNIEISSESKDMHSGIEGGAIAEPMQDMVQLLATLTSSDRKVVIPGFYDRVRPQDEEERLLFTLLESVTQTPASLLAARWREPSLTIHYVQGSGPRNQTVIPATVTAQVSVRIVPDQDVATIGSALRQFLQESFAKQNSPNKLKVSICHTADWWLGNLEHPWFKALEGAIQDEWGIEPLRIREGGSIPSVPFLEKEFNCPALHLPMGQSLDQAHLPNERISLANLRRGQSVIERFLLSISADPAPAP